MPTLLTGAPGSAVSDFRNSPSGVTFEAGPGDNLVLGSRFDDSFHGGAGSDALFGNRGDDTLRGGEGLDAATGGRGDDTFVFAPGDLITSRASATAISAWSTPCSTSAAPARRAPASRT